MKKFTLPLVLVAMLATLYQPVAAQSQSFQTFRSKFDAEDDFHCFRVSGFMVRSVLAMAGEPEAREAVRGIHKVRLAVVPREAFAAQEVTVEGFRRVLVQDSFGELMAFRENGEQVTVYSNSPTHRDDQCYMMLVEGDDDVVLIEISGHVNEEYFKKLVRSESQRT